MTTLKDIADETGYSIATISRVLNHDKFFSATDETRHTILTAAEKLNYINSNSRTQSAAKKQEKQKQQIKIGLAYWYSASDEINDPYYLSIRLAIENYCEQNNIDLKLFCLLEVTDLEIKNAKLDGLIALGKYSEAEIKRLSVLTKNFVLVDCYTKQYDIDVVMVDLKEATKDLISYLFSLEIKDIGFIGGVEGTLDGTILIDNRLKTFLKYEFADSNCIYQGTFNADSGYEIMTDIIKNHQLKKAYIVASDAMAFGALKALNENNIAVPEVVSILSFNNISMSSFTIPALTTVDLNTHLVGTTAAEVMHERIRSKRTIAKKIFIPTKLIKRESSL